MDANQNNLYLRHHGIDNQKWGVRNGPPYPLSPEDHKAVISKGDVKTLQEHSSEFKDWEVKAVIDRFNLNQEVDRLNSKLVEKGKKQIKDEEFIQKANMLANKVNAVGNVLGKTSYASEHAMKTYNAVARTLNSLLGKDMPVIDLKKVNKTKKEKMREESENRRKKNLEMLDNFKRKKLENDAKIDFKRKEKQMSYEMDIAKKKAYAEYEKKKNKKSLVQQMKEASKKKKDKEANLAYEEKKKFVTTRQADSQRESAYNYAEYLQKKYNWSDKEKKQYLKYELERRGLIM